MAGINQHYLPRFLLKGFASRTAGEEVFTWTYRKGAKVFEPNIKNISAERYFYGKQGELSADEEITELERRYGTFIDELREIEGGEGIRDTRIIEFIAHLCVRTKHLRDSFRESSEFLMKKVSEHLSDYNNIRKFILDNPELAEDVVGKMMDEHNVPPVYRDFLMMMVTELAPALLDEEQPEFKMMIESLIGNTMSMIPKATREGHIQALAKHPIPEPRVENYSRLNWFMYTPSCPTILGDIGVLFETGDKQRFKSLNEKDDEIRNVILPISSNRVIIGTPLDKPHIDFDINDVVATRSREFFISSVRSSEMESLHLRIGEQSDVISKDELEEIIREAFSQASASKTE